MTPAEIVGARVALQLGQPCARPAEVVREFLAVQAQDLRASLWGIGLRTEGATEGDVEHALAEGEIVRTWPMRGTLHAVAPEDVRWMLALLTPRVLARSAARHRELDLDGAVLAKAERVLVGALEGGRRRTRPELFEALERAGIATAAQRGVHVLGYLSMRGVLCLGPLRGKQPMFALLDEWAPGGRALGGDEALAELARRYFARRAPATDRDLAWWAGLPLGLARRAIDAAGSPRRGEHVVATGPATGAAPRARVDLLPAYDEYTVAYQNRSAFLDAAHAARTRNAIMSPVVLVAGRVAGRWSRTMESRRVRIDVELFGEPTRAVRAALDGAIERYARFLDRDARSEIVVSP